MFPTLKISGWRWTQRNQNHILVVFYLNARSNDGSSYLKPELPPSKNQKFPNSKTLQFVSHLSSGVKEKKSLQRNKGNSSWHIFKHKNQHNNTKIQLWISFFGNQNRSSANYSYYYIKKRQLNQESFPTLAPELLLPVVRHHLRGLELGHKPVILALPRDTVSEKYGDMCTTSILHGTAKEAFLRK